MFKKLSVFALAMMLVASLLCETATAKEFPSKPIEIICPYPAGASIDLMSRLVADIAPKFLGQRMVVINKMNRDNADFAKAMATVQEITDARLIPVQLPWGEKEDFKGVI